MAVPVRFLACAFTSSATWRASAGSSRATRRTPATAHVRGGTQALHRGDQCRRPRCKGGRGDRDRRHGLPRRRRGLHVQLADPRGPRPRVRVSSSRRSGPSTRASSRRAATRRSSSACTRWPEPPTACSTTRSRARRGRTSGSTGRKVGETGINAALCGTWGCPVLLVTGDEASCREGKELLGDGLTTVAVKKGIGQTSARMIVPARARELIEAGREAGALRPQGRRAVRPRPAVRGQGRVQEHDRREADALPARRRVPRRPHDRVTGRRLVDGLEAVLLRRPLALHGHDRRAVGRRRGPRSPRALRCRARARAARRGHLRPIRRATAAPACQVVHDDDASRRDELERPLALGAHLSGGLRFQPPPSKNRRSNGASGGSTSCQSPWRTRTFGKSANRRRAGSRTIVVDLDRDERRFGGHARRRSRRRRHPFPCRSRRACRSGGTRRARPSRRPTSRIDERSKPIASASASARRTSSGTWPTTA